MKTNSVRVMSVKDLTIQEFLVENPDFIKPILVGSILGAIKPFCEDPRQVLLLEQDVDKIVADMLSRPATELFKTNTRE